MADPDFYAKALADYPDGYRMALTCRRCGHIRSMPFADLLERLGPATTVGEVAARGRCGHVRHDPMTSAPLPPCGGRPAAAPYPDPRGWRGLAPPASVRS